MDAQGLTQCQILPGKRLMVAVGGLTGCLLPHLDEGLGQVGQREKGSGQEEFSNMWPTDFTPPQLEGAIHHTGA